MEDRIKAISLARSNGLINEEEAKMYARNTFASSITPSMTKSKLKVAKPFPSSGDTVRKMG